MDSIRTHSDRNIDSVIDKHARSQGPGNLDHSRNECGQFTGLQVAFAHLDELTSGSGSDVDCIKLSFSAPRKGKRQPEGDQVNHRSLKKSLSNSHVYD